MSPGVFVAPALHEPTRERYFAALREDSQVQYLNAEQKIRTTTDKLLQYVDEANAAQLRWNCHKKKNIAQPLGRVEDIIGKATESDSKTTIIQTLDRINQILAKQYDTVDVVPDFKDIAALSYHLGSAPQTAADKPERVLDNLVADLNYQFNQLAKNGDVSSEGFEPLFAKSLYTIFKDTSAVNQERVAALEDIYAHSCEYLNRQMTMLKLAGLETHISWVQGEDAVTDLKRMLHGDFSWMWRPKAPTLPTKQRNKIARHFSKWAEVDGEMFRYLFLTATMIKKVPEPVAHVEKNHREALEANEKQGYQPNRFSYTRSVPAV
jgi:hypothetical protein